MRKHFNKAIARLTLLGSMGISFVAHAGSNLVISGDTVYDKDTDLTWMRCSVGMRWVPDRNRCVGVKREFTFDEAQKTAQGGWRVPRREELETLIQKQEGKCDIDHNAFPDMEKVCWYWSSSESGASDGWTVLFNQGKANNGNRSFPAAVRLVRGGQ